MMGLFSRRKKQDDTVSASQEQDAAVPGSAAGVAQGETAIETPAANVDISVQAFRGLGAPAGPEVAAPGTGEPEAVRGSTEETLPVAREGAVAAERVLPLAPLDPPAQTETIPGMKDNVLLRDALAQIAEGATHAQLLGVLRQALQGHLFLRVQGDAGEQLKEGKPLAVGIVTDGEDSYMLAFSAAAAVRDSVQLESDPAATSAVVQPVQSVLQQVVEGPFAGLIIDNASAPHRVVLPSAVLRQAIEQADPSFALKTILAAERQADSEARMGEALASARLWVAVNAPEGEDGQMGVAEAHMADGTRFLQVFSHPLEVIALGRGEQPMPFSGEQLGKVLAGHPELAGVLVDPAGPTIAVRREALVSVLALADAD